MDQDAALFFAGVAGFWTFFATIFWIVYALKMRRLSKEFYNLFSDLRDHQKQTAKMMTQISETLREKNETR